MKRIKVALVLNVRRDPYGLGNHVPLSLLYLGARLTREGHEVLVLDRRTYQNDNRFFYALNSAEADLVGISLYNDGYSLSYELMDRIRNINPRCKIVLGGPEVSANRKVIAHIFSKIDFFLSGEAEYTLSQLANCLANSDEEDLESIPGLSYRKDGNDYHNPIPAPVKDVDSIPFPKRDLISHDVWKKSYYRLGLKQPTDTILTSRGCPYSCKFCYRLTPGYRARSPENVLAEMGEIYAFGTRGLCIVDDNFLINRKRCAAILEGVLERGWKFALKCRGRVNNIDSEILRLMKKAGVRSVTFGVESGSQKMLSAMGKQTTVEQNYAAIRMTREAGLQCYVDLMIGFPGETRDTIRETSEFLSKAKPTGIQIGCLFPLHGTEVYEKAERDGTLVSDWGVLQEYPWVKLPWCNDIRELQKEARKIRRMFWLDPSVIARAFISNVSHFGWHDYWCALMYMKGRLLPHKT